MGWNLNDAWMLKSITAWRKLDTASYIDIDASQFELGDVFVAVDQKQCQPGTAAAVRQRQQLQGDLRPVLPRRERAVAPGSVRRRLPRASSARRSISCAPSTTTCTPPARPRSRSVNWEFVPTWTLSAGVRYTRENKEYDRTTSTFWGAPLGALDQHRWHSAGERDLERDHAFAQPAEGLQRQRHGLCLGQPRLQVRRLQRPRQHRRPNQTARVRSGIRLDLRARPEDAVGRSPLLGQHRGVPQRVRGLPGARVGGAGVRRHPDLRFPGDQRREADHRRHRVRGRWRCSAKRTTLSTQLGWMDARYDKFVDLRVADPTRVDYNPSLHEHVPFSPDFTGRVALQHGFALGDKGTLTVGGDASYRSETWLSVDNRESLRQGAYTLFGLYGVWDSPEYAWQVRAGVRNLTDETYKTEGQEFSSVGNIQTAYYRPAAQRLPVGALQLLIHPVEWPATAGFGPSSPLRPSGGRQALVRALRVANAVRLGPDCDVSAPAPIRCGMPPTRPAARPMTGQHVSAVADAERRAWSWSRRCCGWGCCSAPALYGERRPRRAGGALAPRLRAVAGGALHLVDLLRHGDAGRAHGWPLPPTFLGAIAAVRAGGRVPGAAGAAGARDQRHLDRRPGRHAPGQGRVAGGDGHPGRGARHDSLHRAAAQGGGDELRAC